MSGAGEGPGRHISFSEALQALDLLDSFGRQQNTPTDPTTLFALHLMRAQITRQRLIRQRKILQRATIKAFSLLAEARRSNGLED